MFKTLLEKIAAAVVMLIVLFAPFLLLIDFKKFVPAVLSIWLLSVVYFIFIKSRR